MRLALAALAASAATTPAQLLQQIGTAAWPASGLPAHVTIAQVGAIPPSAQGKKYHAVGEIAFILKGPNPNDEIVFEVFPNASDASGDLHHPHLNKGDVKHGQVSGVGESLLITTGAVQKGKKMGVTIAAAVRGNVIVQAVTTSSANTKQGDNAMAAALLKAGLAHLKTFGGPTA